MSTAVRSITTFHNCHIITSIARLDPQSVQTRSRRAVCVWHNRKTHPSSNFLFPRTKLTSLSAPCAAGSRPFDDIVLVLVPGNGHACVNRHGRLHGGERNIESALRVSWRLCFFQTSNRYILYQGVRRCMEEPIRYPDAVTSHGMVLYVSY